MPELEAVRGVLDAAVTRNDLVGYVCGVREAGRSTVVAGGSRSIGGAPLTPDAVFPLSSNTKPLGGVLTMALVERGFLDPETNLERYLPELRSLRVLARPDAPLDETVPLDRPPTLEHLLTMTAGFGWAAQNPALGEAMAARQIAPGPYAPPIDPETYLRRLGGLPLAGQPGDGWWYHTCSDVLGILLARAMGNRLGDLVEEFVTRPLGLTDVGFVADPARMPISYGAGADGRPEPLAVAERFAGPPVFDSLACGLAGTVGDYLRFLDVLLDGGPVIGSGSADRMCTDHLTASQIRSAEGFLGKGCGYGYQVEVRPGGVVGWAGGLGTIAYADRRSGRAAAVFTSQAVDLSGTEDALEQVWRLLAR